jgi:hypothetical protein
MVGRIWATHTLYNTNNKMIGAVLVDDHTYEIKQMSSEELLNAMRNGLRIENLYIDKDGKSILECKFDKELSYYNRIKRNYAGLKTCYTMNLNKIVTDVNINTGKFSMIMAVESDEYIRYYLDIAFNEYVQIMNNTKAMKGSELSFTNGKIDVVDGRKAYLTYCDTGYAQLYKDIPLTTEGKIIIRGHDNDNKLPVGKVAILNSRDEIDYKAPNELKGSEIVKGDTRLLWRIALDNFSQESVYYMETYKNWAQLETPRNITRIGRIGGHVNNLIFSDDVVDIGNECCIAMDDILKVKLGSNVEHIGDSAFKCCRLLKKVAFGGNEKVIEAYAFSNCLSLSGALVTTALQICAHAFEYTNLEIVNLLNIKFIGPRAFEGCKNIRKVKINKSIKQIKEGAFGNCTGLKEIVFEPNNGGEIGLNIDVHAFANCKNLETIRFPEHTVWIHKGAFEGCDSLREIVVPKGVVWTGSDRYNYEKGRTIRYY